MKVGNHTSLTEFILLGLTDDPELRVPLFFLILIIYILTLVGNIGIFTLIILEPNLHIPMYIFLSNLSLSDLCYSTVIAPRMLMDLLSENRTISLNACAVQAFFFFFFAGMEVFLLSLMAYDRYVAICLPLVYNYIMSKYKCLKLLTTAYLSGALAAVIHEVCTFSDSFCGSNSVDHFYCDELPLMKLSCSDTFFRVIGAFLTVDLFAISALLIIVVSYVCILSSILQMPSAVGKKKAFSTCGSHLTALSLFFGTALFMYLRLPGSRSVTQTKVVSLFYTIVFPMLNPLIYSVRNQQVKEAFWKIIKKKKFLKPILGHRNICY